MLCLLQRPAIKMPTNRLNSSLAVAAENAVSVSLKITFLGKLLLQPRSGAVDADFGSGYRAVADVGDLLCTHAFQIVQDQGRAVIRGQTVDHLTNAGTHLHRDETLSDLWRSVMHIAGLIHIDDIKAVFRVCGSNPLRPSKQS